MEGVIVKKPTSMDVSLHSKALKESTGKSVDTTEHTSDSQGAKWRIWFFSVAFSGLLAALAPVVRSFVSLDSGGWSGFALDLIAISIAAVAAVFIESATKRRSSYLLRDLLFGCIVSAVLFYGAARALVVAGVDAMEKITSTGWIIAGLIFFTTIISIGSAVFFESGEEVS